MAFIVVSRWKKQDAAARGSFSPPPEAPLSIKLFHILYHTRAENAPAPADRRRS